MFVFNLTGCDLNHGNVLYMQVHTNAEQIDKEDKEKSIENMCELREPWL